MSIATDSIHAGAASGTSCQRPVATPAATRERTRPAATAAGARPQTAPARGAVERALADAIADASRIGDLLDVLRTERLWLPLPDDGSPVVTGTSVTLPTVSYLGSEFVPAYSSAELLAGLTARPGWRRGRAGRTGAGRTGASRTGASRTAASRSADSRTGPGPPGAGRGGRSCRTLSCGPPTWRGCCRRASASR